MEKIKVVVNTTEMRVLEPYLGMRATFLSAGNSTDVVYVGKSGIIEQCSGMNVKYRKDDGSYINTADCHYVLEIDVPDVNDELIPGELILVDDQPDNWNKNSRKRIYIGKDPFSDKLLCVSHGFEQESKNTPEFRITKWLYGKKIVKPQWKDCEVKISDSYTAVVKADCIKVGCSEFSFAAITDLYLKMVEAQDFAKTNKE